MVRAWSGGPDAHLARSCWLQAIQKAFQHVRIALRAQDVRVDQQQPGHRPSQQVAEVVIVCRVLGLARQQDEVPALRRRGQWQILDHWRRGSCAQCSSFRGQSASPNLVLIGT